ncbi:spermidine/putrescine ABC transporter permease [Sinorhizobium sp. A49]|uniref:ABC transporter permease n=1 Tax=Sinorhizobium sp. A49 TaxID=1945861 RepID=UPI0009D36B9F|nr:ABC transporter permease subunit [Sinorhizobium sp. A49]OOG65219.1 spermidine/putrescine ABC transporter permease [Sinorhizobium sp. A49]
MGSEGTSTRNLKGLLLIGPPLAVMVCLLLYPAGVSIVQTLQETAADGSVSWSLARYHRFFTDPYSVANYVRTVWTTVVTLILLIAICLPIAIYLHFTRSRMAAVVQALALFPMFVPGIIVAYALIRYIGPNGLLQSLLEVVGFNSYSSPYLTPWGPVIGLVWDHMPLTLLILTAGMAKVSQEAIEAARDVGAGYVVIFHRIILPLMVDSLLVVMALNVISLFGSFVIPYMLGPASPEMMGPYMLRTFSEVRQPDFAAAQAVITFLTCSVFGILYVVMLTRKQDV